jgi:hypothetical protein
MVSPAALAMLDPGSSSVLSGIGREEARGWPLGLSVEGGGSRLLWFRLEEGEWRVSGDTGLDALMGSAAILCRDYVLSTVLPAVASGSEPSGFSCPFSGSPYSIVGGRLSCTAGHLGEGLDFAGDACSLEREEAAGMVGAWVAAGNPFPQDFAEIWEASGGTAGTRGGYRCPVNGYSYFTIVDSGVWCPYHQILTPIIVPGADLDRGY